MVHERTKLYFRHLKFNRPPYIISLSCFVIYVIKHMPFLVEGIQRLKYQVY
jgi:hypothetical protein